MSFVPATSTSTATSTFHKHVIDLELLPDESNDGFLQPQPLGTATPIHPTTTTSTSPSIKHKNKKDNKKHVKIKTSRNITYYIPSTTISNKHVHVSPKVPAPSSPPPSHYYTATPTITFAEWEKIPINLQNLPYTFCIQCEKPIKHQYWYDHHMQAHAQKHPTATTNSPDNNNIIDKQQQQQQPHQ